MDVPQSAIRPERPPADISFLRQQFGDAGANDLVYRIDYAESGGNTYEAAGPPRLPPEKREQYALGAGQFTGPTWKDLLVRYRPDLIRQNPWLDESIKRDPRALMQGQNRAQVSASGIMNTRLDYPVSRDMTARYADQLARQLQDRQFAVTPGNVYLMYFAGTGDGPKILEAIARDPNIPVAQVAPKLARENQRLIDQYPTVGELQAGLTRKIVTARPDLLPFNRKPPPRP